MCLTMVQCINVSLKQPFSKSCIPSLPLNVKVMTLTLFLQIHWCTEWAEWRHGGVEVQEGEGK